MFWKVLCAVAMAAYGIALLLQGRASNVTMLRWSGFIVGALLIITAVFISVSVGSALRR
jgi:hypothetical protein